MDKDLAGVGEVTLLIAVALVTLLPEEVGIKLDRRDIMIKAVLVLACLLLFTWKFMSCLPHNTHTSS